MKFRKKLVVIEAIQWLGDFVAFERWMVEQGIEEGRVYKDYGKSLRVTTLEGNHRAHRGDWIIKGVKGELYPCKPDIFEQTYKKVESEEL